MFLGTYSLRKQPTFGDATTGFPAKWRLRNERRNSILMTRHYQDLGSASNWSCRVGNLIQPIRSTAYALESFRITFTANVNLYHVTEFPPQLFAYSSLLLWNKSIVSRYFHAHFLFWETVNLNLTIAICRKHDSYSLHSYLEKNLLCLLCNPPTVKITPPRLPCFELWIIFLWTTCNDRRQDVFFNAWSVSCPFWYPGPYYTGF